VNLLHIAKQLVTEARHQGLTDDEIRRLLEAQL